ncbi:uncharacterized protein LOC123663040 [Melitaea cinxia]|uniref:uncharacterized protein LOC123663040 n=1 Tax=Melitaea cinxia TaxID=113334 RepID=UPI001E26F05E|nr:uncharacterized protein LOC123663040 [Melitaea cinxia]
MSKRLVFPQQCGERKKPKLDITVSDHNFPLSQNAGPSKDVSQVDNWGDDNDDEILLLASQACEEAYNDNNTTLPDYSICMQPSSTSTQINKETPSTSKQEFSFKKPTFSPLSAVSTKMRSSFKTISSPLPGMAKDCKTDGVKVSDEIIFNDHIHKGQDFNQMYRQLLQLQEENTKLKSENGKLLEKCFTKEGEASILRTQLKTCQTAVDNARLEKIKAQEKAQMEWSEKLNALSNQMHDLQNQLDFKNLEMISVKEKCKMLESNKVKLTQVTVAGNDIFGSQRHNNGVCIKQDAASHVKKVKTLSNSVQTEDKSHFLKLNLVLREEESKLSQILPFILEPTTDQYSILNYNEKLRQRTDVQNKCRIFSTFHKLPKTRVKKDICKTRVNLNCIYEDLSYISANRNGSVEMYLNIVKVTMSTLKELRQELEAIIHRLTSAFQKEMDERYIDATSKPLIVKENELLSGRILYKEEQGLLARRVICVLFYLLEDNRNNELYEILLDDEKQSNEQTYSFVNEISEICLLLDNATCALLYSGLLTSITLLLQAIASHRDRNTQLLKICKSIIISRPLPFVTKHILNLLVKLSCNDNILPEICSRSSSGNLKLDYDQGVLLYKKDSCTLQVILKQTEVALKCIEKHRAVQEALDLVRALLRLYCNLNSQSDDQLETHRCDCHTVFLQVIVFALRICVDFLNIENRTKLSDNNQSLEADILSSCLSAVSVLSRTAPPPSLHGPLLALAATLRGHTGRSGTRDTSGTTGDNGTSGASGIAGTSGDSDLCNMLSEITHTFQTCPDELPPSYHKKAWIKSFQAFSLTD